VLGLWRSFRRKAFAREPLPAAWRATAEARLPFVAAFGAEERERFYRHLAAFARDKSWEGAAGLVVDDTMKVVISGAAARLSMNLDYDVYDRLRSVVIYPAGFLHPDRDGVVLGLVNSFGTMVLSWDAVRRGIANPVDGQDTAIHELAHVLDLGDGAFDGTPPLERSTDYHAWVKAFSAHYRAFRKRPHKSILRKYAATNEAEFFAVATEMFFERPRDLLRKHPALYAELSRYYRVDPVR